MTPGLRVSLVAPRDAEAEAAWAWLSSVPAFASRRFDLAGLNDGVKDADLVWVHAATDTNGINPQLLAAFAARGKRLLLTLRGAGLVVPMGLETVRPNDLLAAEWRDDTDELLPGDAQLAGPHPRIRGLATFGPHPLVDGLHNGTYTWAPVQGEHWVRCCYAGGARPAEGRVVAVERAHALQNADRIVAWEYPRAGGGILCIGAFVQFAARDGHLRPRLERLVANAIALCGHETAERTWWPRHRTSAAPSGELSLPEPLNLEGALPEVGSDDAALASEGDSDEQFDLAGRRLMLVGTERAGIREVWVHPHRVVSSWDVSADGVPMVGTRMAVTPDVIARTLETPRRRVMETCFVALEQPLAIIEYHSARKGRDSLGRAPAHFEVTCRLDLRRMWPFPPGCGDSLRFGHDGQGRVAVVESESDDGIVALFTDRKADLRMRSVHVRDVPVVECVVRVALDEPLRLAIVAAGSRGDLEQAMRAVRRLGVRGMVRQRQQRARTLREARLSFRTDDLRVGHAVEWAKRRLDAFLADVPGVGRSLLTGYAPSTPGWGDGRPGHAWFTTRDSVWSSMALLAAGEFSTTRQVLHFLGAAQDVTGKVPHEVTTSGQYHYDAADATPLYLLLVSRYLAWTGDRDFVASIWPHVEAALAYCLSTDEDGDGIIEHGRAGHGWIETGPLASEHVSLYLAAVWRAAMEGLGATSKVLGQGRMSVDCFASAARVGSAIDADLYDERRAIYALERRSNGRRGWTQTALQASAVVLGAANPVRARKYLDTLAGEGFATPWGVRLLSADDPRFNPESTNAGAVRPVFTGWAALAEYGAGRSEAGFAHLHANLRLPFRRQLGAFDEALNGQEERAAGTCPDSALSAAMLLSPIVDGLMGVTPDAPEGRLTVAPALPAEWDWMEARGIRCGETVTDIRVRRRAGLLQVALRRALGPPIWVTVAPAGVEPLKRVEADGNLLRPQTETLVGEVRHAVTLQVMAEHDVRFYSG